MEVQLTEWAAWRAWNAAVGATRTLGPPGPVELDRAIALLPSRLENTVKEVYGTRSSMSEHARRLGCPEGVLARRIGQAHRLLIDILDTQLDDAARELERGDMKERLARIHVAQS